MSSKIITFGFACNGPNSYIRSTWNQVSASTDLPQFHFQTDHVCTCHAQVDFVIVCISLIVLLAESVPQLRPLRVLRVMRVLRPLRLISRNAGMKLIISSLFKAMPAVGNVFGVIFVLQLVFCILGMQLFSGTFGTCNNPAITHRDECHDGRMLGALEVNTPGADELEHGGWRRSLKGGGSSAWQPGTPLKWSNPVYGSFDNFGDAMRLLYIMSSGDQWEQPLFAMMGASEPGIAVRRARPSPRRLVCMSTLLTPRVRSSSAQPERNDFSPMAIFALAWMFCGYIFAMNLFVGVVVDNFSRMQKEHDGSATMTQEQKQVRARRHCLDPCLLHPDHHVSSLSLSPPRTSPPPRSVDEHHEELRELGAGQGDAGPRTPRAPGLLQAHRLDSLRLIHHHRHRRQHWRHGVRLLGYRAGVHACIRNHRMFVHLSHISLLLDRRRTRRCSLPTTGAWTSSA